jgi:hypothetical protein
VASRYADDSSRRIRRAEKRIEALGSGQVHGVGFSGRPLKSSSAEGKRRADLLIGNTFIPKRVAFFPENKLSSYPVFRNVFRGAETSIFEGHDALSRYVSEK